MEGGLYNPSLLYKPVKAYRSCYHYLRNREFSGCTAERWCTFNSKRMYVWSIGDPLINGFDINRAL